METVKVKVRSRDDEYTPVVPVIIPPLSEVREFAAKLHRCGKSWKGELFGWSAEYNPQKSEPPLDSKMCFTPADFCIGESDIWFYSLMWEQGKDVAPVEFLDDRNVVEKLGEESIR